MNITKIVKTFSLELHVLVFASALQSKKWAEHVYIWSAVIIFGVIPIKTKFQCDRFGKPLISHCRIQSI